MVEKKKLKRSLKIVGELAEKSFLSEVNAFILRERMRYSLKVLGAQNPDRKLVVEGIRVVKDKLPFKTYRLRKLINGRRTRQ